MSANKIQFAIFMQGSQAVRVADYLNTRAAWTPNLSHCAILIESGGKQWLDASYNMGDLDMLAVQCESAAARLELDKSALVRSAIEDEAWVPYLLLEPAQSGEALLSLIYLAETEMAYEYPIPSGSQGAQALYAFVEKNRDQLVRAPEDVEIDRYLLERPFGLDGIIESLRREAALARQLYAQMEVPFYPRGSRADGPGDRPAKG